MPVSGARRATALVLVAGLVPVPFVDTLLQNAVRRAFVSHVSDRYGLALPDAEIRALADAPLAPGRRLAAYVVKRVLGRLLLPVAVWSVVRTARDTWSLPHRVLATRALAMPAAD